jgi:hypothetical protein
VLIEAAIHQAIRGARAEVAFHFEAGPAGREAAWILGYLPSFGHRIDAYIGRAANVARVRAGVVREARASPLAELARNAHVILAAKAIEAGAIAEATLTLSTLDRLADTFLRTLQASVAALAITGTTSLTVDTTRGFANIVDARQHPRTGAVRAAFTLRHSWAAFRGRVRAGVRAGVGGHVVVSARTQEREICEDCQNM